MESFLNNQWTITIGGGVILAIILKALEKIFSYFYNSHKISKTNEEINIFLKKIVINKVSISNDMIETAIKYFSRKHKVNISKLYSKVEFLENILIEIHQEIYMTKEEKESITESLFALKEKIEEKNILKEDTQKYKYNNGILSAFLGISIVLGVFSGYFGMKIITKINNVANVTGVFGVKEFFIIIYILIITIALTLALLNYYESSIENEKNDLSNK